MTGVNKTRPNIVFILADDLGFSDVSWNDPTIITPNLETLYKSSLRLHNYYVQQVCTPSRAAILTGKYPIHLGMQHSFIDPYMPRYLPLNVTTLADELKLAGYSTHACGKWHLGHCNVRVTPTFRGFDTFYGLWLGGGDHFTHMKSEGNRTEGLDFRDNLDLVYDQNVFTQRHSIQTEPFE